ncbi:globin family protein [Seonamhaeicola maritimus]|uniref:Hemin receptor n=1 Tax=Seonamhaeicola maritimus TaxID=2591822 RepID=A0A5C7GFU9_9FLAO|nr:globin family protein [Seonamhaeicola maritimus]TXG35360.1 hemin receptor [Seonamhaeicola maritimus]
MDGKTIYLVQESFNKVRPISDTVAEMFYHKLFQLDPSSRHLFPKNQADMQLQSRKLISMLGVAISGLTNFETLIPVLEDLGRRHLEYKVEHFQYQIVGEALLATLEEGLGNDFTYEVKNAWVDVYFTMSNVMMNAAYQKN